VRVTLLTREYPPNVYGGAGVHVTYLARELAKRVPVEVRAFEGPRGRPSAGEGPPAEGFEPWSILAGPEPYRPALEVMSVDLAMMLGLEGTVVVHSHTWYTNLAGHLAKLTHGIPHVMTTHSLEPLRPWKATQLGEGGYALSSFCERTAIEAADAVIAVSSAMRDDVLRAYPGVDPERVGVIHNGVDTDEYAPTRASDALLRHGVDLERPYVLFVGRITRQKGLRHLLNAAGLIDRSAQLVLCASAPDSEADLAEAAEGVERAWRERGGGVVWLREPVPVPDLTQLFSRAAVFVCPSIYEPMGIVNLEAMACGAPVVATDTGGIPEVVVDGETGLLVPIEQRPDGEGEPADPHAFAAALAERVNTVLADPPRSRRMGQAGRARALDRFSWRAVAGDVLSVYERLAPALLVDQAGG
jgi:starch synthase